MTTIDGGRISIELSHDRLINLTKLPQTCLLSRHVYPAVKYYLRKGEVIYTFIWAYNSYKAWFLNLLMEQEPQCHRDLVATIAELAGIAGEWEAGRGPTQRE